MLEMGFVSGLPPCKGSIIQLRNERTNSCLYLIETSSVLEMEMQINDILLYFDV